MILKTDRISKVLEINDLYIPEKLQRDIRLSKVKDIVKNFNYKSIGRILCNYRDGKYYIIDGQHRVMALNKLKYKAVECDVYINLSEMEEAEIYKYMAKTSLHSTYEKFRAELVLGTELHTDINNTIKNLGFNISNHKNSKNISCIKDLTFCYKKDKELLIQVINIFKSCFDLKNGISGVELKGMFLFLIKALENKKFDLNFFTKRIATLPQSKLSRLGAENKQATNTTPAKGYAIALLVTYNHNKTEKNRISLDLFN